MLQPRPSRHPIASRAIVVLGSARLVTSEWAVTHSRSEDFRFPPAVFGECVGCGSRALGIDLFKRKLPALLPVPLLELKRRLL